MNIDLTLGQKNILTPQIEQSIRILQMSSQELMDYVNEISVENPVIELEVNNSDDNYKEKLKSKIEWIDSIDEENRVYYHSNNNWENEGFDIARIKAIVEESLQEYLQNQIKDLDISCDDIKIAAYIINYLNEYGYLDSPVDDIANKLGVTTQHIIKVLKIIQSLEPYGVGARNLSECLLIQLRNKGIHSDLIENMVCNHLESLGKNQLNIVAKKLKISIEEVKKLYSIIKSLNPRPGNVFISGEKPRFITADIIVAKFIDYYEVMLYEFSSPKIIINSYYKKLLKETSDENIKKYIAKKVEQANWISKCIIERNKTLLNVSRAIVEVQKEFFEKGPGYLSPLIMAEIARKVNVHESTVSRSVRGKYLQCTWGTFELKFFFTHGLEMSGKDNISVDAIKTKIKDLINEENKRKPYSDQKITDLLNKCGINIARRTVAKYREELSILPASGRKNY